MLILSVSAMTTSPSDLSQALLHAIVDSFNEEARAPKSYEIPSADFEGGVRATFGNDAADQVAALIETNTISAQEAADLLVTVLFMGATRGALPLTIAAIGEAEGKAAAVMSAEDALRHPFIGKWLPHTPAQAVLQAILAGAVFTCQSDDAPIYTTIQLVVGPDQIGDNGGVIVKANFQIAGRGGEALEVEAQYGTLGFEPPVSYGAKIDAQWLYRLGVYLRDPMMSLVLDRHRRSWSPVGA